MKRAVVLLSGGLDSATTLAICRQDFQPYALSFDYGQRHNIEIAAARKIADSLGALEHRIAKIDLRIFGNSALTDDIAVPKNRESLADASPEIPITYVPARNTIFLSHALAYAEVINSADIFIGANAVDYSGYPDCRPEYLAAFEKLAQLGTKRGVEGAHFKVHAPLLELSKAEIILRGAELHVDFALTHSCYDPDPSGVACGECDSCRLRLAGFRTAGMRDPIAYRA